VASDFEQGHGAVRRQHRILRIARNAARVAIDGCVEVASLWKKETHYWDRCYDFLIIFDEKFSKKWLFDSNYC
jgi:hypothetical protein